ncbi:alpha/beta fold hydrolase [Lysinibacillus sp. NPDC092081]|uniref:alpha/beta fold hydrolase n=1 Tax=Lysinibacillus sp. NPDC092081 TaxID=3364131 RepID=UPI00382AF4C9
MTPSPIAEKWIRPLITLIKILQENMSFAIPHDFSKAQCNILVTVGEKEKGNMKKSALHLVVNSNPNCQGVMLSNIGHGVSLANPEFFNRFVEEWLIDGKLPEGKIIK